MNGSAHTTTAPIFFVQGSHREGSGVALLDALACGLVPVVTDIPSFRMITRQAEVGGLWPVGDAQAFQQTLLRLCQPPLTEPQAIMDFYDQHWSTSAVGRQAYQAYQDILARRRGV